MTNRQGFSLAELIVGMVVASVVSAAMVQLMVVQSQFMSTQEGRSNARNVARSTTGLVMSDLRMVQTQGSIIAANGTSITFRVPFATGLICGDTGGGTDVMFQAFDAIATAALPDVGGYGMRDGGGNIVWQNGGVGVGNPKGTAACTAGNDDIIVPAQGFEVRNVTPVVAGGFRGAPVFLYRQITYSFGASASVAGGTGLFRQVGGGAPEELAAPFDPASTFNFYADGSAAADVNPPADLDDLRGIELVLVGVNERAAAIDDAERAPLRTAVFFKN